MRKLGFLFLLIFLPVSLAFGQSVPACGSITIPPDNSANGFTIADNDFSILSSFLAGLCSTPATVTSSLQCAGGGTGCLPSGLVNSFNGRIGAVVPATGDYSFSQISGTISTSQIPATGNATKFVSSSGLSGGNGTIVCEDASGNLKDSGCSTSGGGAVLLSPGAGVDQTINQTSTSNLLVNRINYFKSAAALGIQAAINDCANNPGSGCTVILPPGTTTACNISVPAKVKLVGHGVNGTLLKCGTNNQPILSITGNNVELYDFDVEHTVTPIAGGDGIVTCGGCDRLKIYDVRSANNYIGFNLGWVTYSELFDGIAEYNVSNGVQFTPDQTNKTNQWEVRGFLSEQN